MKAVAPSTTTPCGEPPATPLPMKEAHTMATITTRGGTEIYNKDGGEGPARRFSDGWPLNADAWAGQMLFAYNSIKAFSETDFVGDLQKIGVADDPVRPKRGPRRSRPAAQPVARKQRAGGLAARDTGQRAVPDAALDCVIRIDDHRRVTYINDFAQRRSGCGAGTRRKVER